MTSTEILTILALAVALVVAFEIMRITWYLKTTKHPSGKFERHSPQASRRVLFVGDSIGIGCGTSDQRYSLPGRLGADFPSAHVENASAGMQTLPQADARLRGIVQEGGEPYDLVIVFVGGVDLVTGRPIGRVRRHVRSLLRSAKACGKDVLLVGPNNTGLVPLYRFPLSRWLHRRAYAFDALYRAEAEEVGARFVPLYREDGDIVVERNLFSPDKTHPNDKGYGMWYAELRGPIHESLS
jgi:lysophospholipase L1-like esterase